MEEVDLKKKAPLARETGVQQKLEPADRNEEPQCNRSGCPPPYLKSPTGIMKIVEMILCIITFACSLGGRWSSLGGGWVEFVSMAAFITTAIWFMLHLIDIMPRCLLMRPWEFLSCVVTAALFFISAIVAAVRAQSSDVGGAVAAAAFFSFACVAVYGMVDGYYQIYDWRMNSTITAAVQRSLSSSPGTNTQSPHANV